jgi:hypothetical protein
MKTTRIKAAIPVISIAIASKPDFGPVCIIVAWLFDSLIPV